MKIYIKRKFFTTLFLYLSTILIATSLSASTASNASHNYTIQTFINNIRLLQDQVFSLAEFALENPSEDKTRLTNSIRAVNSNIESLNREILDYLNTLPSISSQNSDVLLAQNALNLVKNSLYQINLLVNTTSGVERLLLLQEFFRLRVNAAETLVGLQNAISA